jgi:ribosomal protein S18 acetylase RimI-like enzyme
MASGPRFCLATSRRMYVTDISSERCSRARGQSGLDKLWTLFGLQTWERLTLISSFLKDIHHVTVPHDDWDLWMIGINPDLQGKGIDSQLIRDGFVRCAALGCPFTVVLGEPA